MGGTDLHARVKAFAKDIVLLCRNMKISYKERSLSDQLLRAATSIGANLYESKYAQSSSDFVSKLEIALKEAFETEYWLELLHETDIVSDEDFKRLHGECGAIRRVLISSINTVKAKQAR